MAAPPSSGGGLGGCLVTEPTTTTTTQVEVFQWLRNLPLAPEYHPTLQEFQDPISYIFKIEKEASQYGICKIVPPVLSAPKKTAISNLNSSLNNSTFTTRQQQIGFCPRKPRPMQKPVWESGDAYKLHDFEAKAKSFERSYLKKCTKKGAFVSAGALSPLEMETLYWKATVDKPFSVEYANDMPGSAFSARKSCGGDGTLVEGATVGETEWNMRTVSRAKGSLLRFMKEEIPGVTSPMLYIAMMFSWFAWHVEDHDLHSLNYMHLGAPKTWYGVPRDAAVAFEEVVRIHGYGGEINPLVTFSVLGEKTTVMSPEVLISSGVPCCRLVQNAGEFVVTFPRAYHSGFSHGFNCGEAANIATPEWLTIAKDAAVRRASVNCPPMVSHFQLLYDLAMELCMRVPINIRTKPRSSRLKDKQKCEGETMVKELFVKNVIRNNDLFHALGKGSPVLLLPLNPSDVSACPNSITNHPSLKNCCISSSIAFTRLSNSNSINPVGDNRMNKVLSFFTVKQKFASLYGRNAFFSLSGNGNAHNMRTNSGKGDTDFDETLPDQRLFSCVTCGVLSFDCVAVIQPREQAARDLMSASEGLTAAVRDASAHEHNYSTMLVEKNNVNDICIASGQSVNSPFQKVEQNREESYTGKKRETSALGLLAQTYGNFSESEDDDQDQVAPSASHCSNDSNMNNHSENKYQSQPIALSSIKQECYKGEGVAGSDSVSGCGDEVRCQTINCYAQHSHKPPKVDNKSDQAGDCSFDSEAANLGSPDSNGLDGKFRDPVSLLPLNSPAIHTRRTNLTDESFAQRSDEDSSCFHVFCLEHAVEAEQQLRSIGGVHIMLLCHPDYPRMEVEAKSLSDELSIDHIWNDITFKEASEDDEEKIQLALNNEESVPGNGDWTVKLGINLSYSAYLSWSPLYSKQMAYNRVIYSAFGRASPASSPTGYDPYEQRHSRQRKMVEGKWCGKIWMSNQVHPFLLNRDLQDQEVEHEHVNHVRPLSDEKLKRKPQNVQPITTPRMYQRKRNARAEIRPLKKAKCIEKGVSSDDAMEGIYDKQNTRMLCNKGSSGFEREVSDDSLEENSDDNHGRIRITMLANSSADTQVSVSDDSLGDKSYRRYRRVDKHRAKSFERANAKSNALLKKRLQKQQRSTRKWIREDALSDDAISDNSLEENVQQLCRSFPKGKQAKYIENEDAASDEPLDCGSRKLKRGNFSGKQVKGSKQEYLFSDNSRKESAYMQHVRRSKIKQAKFSEKDDSISEDSSCDGVYECSKRVTKTKQAEFFEWENAVSDDSQDSAYQRPRRDHNRKKKTLTESEDAVSDDSHDDDRNQRLRRIPKGKRTEVIEREDPESDYLLENSTSWQSRKASRGKQVKFIKEDTVSEDVSDDIPSQQNKMIPKSKRKKSKALRLVKQEANSDAKRVIATSKVINKRTPRRQKDKNQTDANQFDSPAEEDSEGWPSSRLRRRPAKASETKAKAKQQTSVKKAKNASVTKGPGNQKKTKLKDEEGEYQCDIEGCTMSFGSKYELGVHKKNICPVKGCGKKFFSHKYLVQHRRVHLDDRPLKCTWKGCKMTFKWAWARTEHLRVHTGARPYVCAEEGCGQTFRFVSDFSRHKRKTGHSARKKDKNC